MHRITLAHSPDPDDAFMWWALGRGLSAGSHPPSAGSGQRSVISPPGRVNSQRPGSGGQREFSFDIVLDDIQSLNESALRGEYDITAISCAQYPHVSDRYAITSCGASFGENYGPKLVARKAVTIEVLRRDDCTIAVPGLRTTAALLVAMILRCPPARLTPVAFDTVADRVASGEFCAGVVIHEGQLTFADQGLHLVQDVGAWWFERTRLPLPLGLNVIKRDLEARCGRGSLQQVARILWQSIQYALDHRAEAVGAAMAFARGIAFEQADEFIRMYVNRLALDCAGEGRQAIETLLEEGYRAGILPPAGPIEIISCPV